MVDGLSGICSSRGCGEVQIYFQLDTPEPGTGGDPSDYIPLRNAADREIIFTPRESEHSRVPAPPGLRAYSRIGCRTTACPFFHSPPTAFGWSSLSGCISHLPAVCIDNRSHAPGFDRVFLGRSASGSRKIWWL